MQNVNTEKPMYQQELSHWYQAIDLHARHNGFRRCICGPKAEVLFYAINSAGERVEFGDDAMAFINVELQTRPGVELVARETLDLLDDDFREQLRLAMERLHELAIERDLLPNF